MSGESEGTGTPIEEFGWDTEERNDLLPKTGHIRETTFYTSAALLEWMESVWGGVLSHVKTRTIPATGEVWIAKAEEGEAGAIAIRRLGAQNTAAFTFWRPLRKLNIKVPADRQFDVTPRLLKVSDKLTVFVLAMAERESVPRNPTDEAESQVAASAEPRGEK